MSDLTIETESDPRGCIVRLGGELSMHAVQSLNTALNPVIACHHQTVVIDMAGVGVIGSLGMGALVAFKRAVERNGGKVYVACARKMVCDAISRARLDDVLNVRPTVDAAFADGEAARAS